MELKQIEAYVKVCDLKSFSKAADEMFISQPSISAYVNSLEKELQTQLIHRSTKEFLPTKAGKLFYEYARDIITIRDKSVTSLKSLSDCTLGNIDILASSVPAQYILPELLGDFHSVYPNIVFNVTQADTADVVKGISAYKGEIGFVGARIDSAKCAYHDFISEKLVIVAPNRDRFKNVDSKDLAGLLNDEYFVMREPGSGTRLEYEEHLKSLGIKPNKLKISAYFDNTQGILSAVANGLGLSIVSELAAKQYINQKTVIPIYDDSLPERRFYYVLRKNSVVSPTVEVLTDFIKTHKFTPS